MNADLGAITVDQPGKALVCRLFHHYTERESSRGQARSDHGKCAEMSAQREHALALLERALDVFLAFQCDRCENPLP